MVAMHPLTYYGDTPKKCPHCSCLQPNGTFLDLFRKLDFLRNEPQAKEKKSKTENESQSEKNRHTHTRNIINFCLFTERKSLKSRKKLPTLDECYKLLEHIYLYLHSYNRFLA